MAGDRARVSYDPTRKWRGLVAQQGRVTVEADWNEAAAIAAERDRLTTLDVVGPAGTPDGGYGVTAVPAGSPAPATPGDLQIGAGTLYLGGERLDLDAPVTYSAQPDWLDSSTDPLWVPPAIPDADGTSFELVYLLAAEQQVSAVEDPALADVALGGPDTMARLRLQQHFVRQAAKSGDCAGAWAEFTDSLSGQGLTFDPASMRLRSASALQVSFTNEPGPPSLCQPVAAGGYLGAENQLIRVLVTSLDGDGVPTIVWGFDNATFIYRLQAATYDSAADVTTVTLASSPVDSYHYPALGQAVELLRDAVQVTPDDYIASAAGFVSTLASAYDPTQQQLVIAGQPPADYLSAATPQLYLRAWQATAAAPGGQATPLGDTGLAVTLSTSGNFHAGDFWLFALRPIEPAIVYPARYLAGPQPPEGPRTWACPLAVLTWENGDATASSCVPPFPSLVDRTGTGTGCCECTVQVGPSDVDGGASLPKLVASLANQGRVAVCLAPGTYTLSEPLILRPGLDGIALRACGDGVILRAGSEPGPQFTLGLIVVQGLDSVTISGIDLVAPYVAFAPPAESFAGLPGANQDLFKAYSIGLKVAIAISAADAANLAVEDCTFVFTSPGEADIFGAGVFARGTITGLALTGCTFVSDNKRPKVPFYDLAAGNPVEIPYQPVFGYLQVSSFPDQDVRADPADVGAPVLHDAAIERCTFQGVTVPVLVLAQLGTLRVDQNIVRDCYGGFWLVSLASAAQLTMIDMLATGDQEVYASSAGKGLACLLDRLLVIASGIGRVLPATPSVHALRPVRRILAPDDAQLALARQTMSAIYSLAPTAKPGAEAAGAEQPGAEQPGAEQALAETAEAGLPPAISLAFEPRGFAPTQGTVPTADTGTSVILRLDVCDCQVDAVLANSYSGAALFVADLTQAGASALVHGCRLRSRFPMGETLAGITLTEATITGNIVANEVAPIAFPIERQVTSFSIALALTSPFGAPAAAITGNVFIDPTLLPPRPPTVPSVLADWDVLNTVIAYVAPPVVTDISPTRGSAAGGDTVTVTGSGFTGFTDVLFGTASSVLLQTQSDSELSAQTPAGTGTVDVLVVTPAGTSAANAASKYIYDPNLAAAKAAKPDPATAATSADALRRTPFGDASGTAVTKQMKRPERPAPAKPGSG